MTASERMCTVLRESTPSLVGWLVTRFAYRDRERWSAALGAGQVFLDGERVCEDRAAQSGQQLELEPADTVDDEPEVRVLWSDDRLVAIDKPAGLVCVRLSAFPQRTFLRRLERELGDDPGSRRLEPVHRLDRGTSGVLLLARGAEAFAEMQRAFAAREVRKEYLAETANHPQWQSFTIDEPIGVDPRAPRSPRRFTASEGGMDLRTAMTEVARWEARQDHARLHVVPHTGRTHQIRVHLAHVGLPIVGDVLYGAESGDARDYAARLAAAERSHPNLVARTLLHARRLRFTHPRIGQEITIESPVPEDFT
ncbi:MAG: RluA family pseudouridine synthase [Planctomycetota bacterium]